MAEVTINRVGLSAYGAILLAGAYAQLIKPAEPKDWVSNESPMLNGTEYLEPEEQRYKERDVSLTFGIKGKNVADFLAKYQSFIEALQGGVIKLYVPDLNKTYHLIYRSCTAFENFDLKACSITVKFTEPDPTNNSE